MNQFGDVEEADDQFGIYEGKGILQYYQIEDEAIWENFGWLCLIFAVVFILGDIAVTFLDWSKR